MISLSNGRFRNSISPLAIAEIAKSAQKSARDERAGHDGQIVHGPEMRFTERFVDLVFCGAVKYEYMNHLFDLTKKRALMGAMLSQKANHPEGRNDYRFSELQDAVNEGRHHINGLTPGKTLEFGTEVNANLATEEFYLVYRNVGSSSTIGIPILLQPPSLSMVLAGNPVPSVPKFDTIDDMQSSDLSDIQKSGEFFCGEWNYTVRFTANNEPVVMWSGSDNKINDIQNRLHNLWVIATVKREFAESICDTSAERTAIKLTSFMSPDLNNEGQWSGFKTIASDKFKKLVNILHDSLNAEILAIAQQLQMFETLTNPTHDEIKAILLLKERIVLFRQTQNTVIKKIEAIRGNLKYICELIMPDDDIKLADVFRERLNNFTDQMLLFAQSGMDDSKFDAFNKLCKIQRDFFSSFRPLIFFKSVFEQVQEWAHPEIYPAVLPPERVEGLFSLMKNSSNSWETVDKVIKELKTFKIKKNPEIVLGQKYERLLERGLLNEHGVEFFKLDISQKFTANVARLRKIVDSCLMQDIQFSEQELGDKEREAGRIWYDLWNEHENWMYRLRSAREEVPAS